MASDIREGAESGAGFLTAPSPPLILSLHPLVSSPLFSTGQTTGDRLRLRKFWLRVSARSVSPSLCLLPVSLLSAFLQSKDLALTNWILGDSEGRLAEGGRRGRWTERQGDEACERGERQWGRMHACMDGWMEGGSVTHQSLFCRFQRG